MDLDALAELEDLGFIEKFQFLDRNSVDLDSASHRLGGDPLGRVSIPRSEFCGFRLVRGKVLARDWDGFQFPDRNSVDLDTKSSR